RADTIPEISRVEGDRVAAVEGSIRIHVTCHHGHRGRGRAVSHVVVPALPHPDLRDRDPRRESRRRERGEADGAPARAADGYAEFGIGGGAPYGEPRRAQRSRRHAPRERAGRFIVSEQAALHPLPYVRVRSRAHGGAYLQLPGGR